MYQDAATEALAGRLVQMIVAERKKKKPTQREILLGVLRIAAQHETWVTLAELGRKTRFPPASISAQLRHLRKPEYGGWRVERRRREWAKERIVWEYRLGV